MNPTDLAKLLDRLLRTHLQQTCQSLVSGGTSFLLAGANLKLIGSGIVITLPDGRQQTISVSPIKPAPGVPYSPGASH